MRKIVVVLAASVVLALLLAVTPNGSVMVWNGDAGMWAPVAKALPVVGLTNGCAAKWNGDAGIWDCN